MASMLPMLKIFSKEEWNQKLEGLGEYYEIYVPARDGDFHTFGLLNQGTKADFEYTNTRLSPKSILFPQSERMFEYNTDPEEPEAYILREVVKSYGPIAIVGIRPCDVHALQIMRVNFDCPDYQDPWWGRRFASMVVVGLGCNEPRSSCFCTSVGGGPFSELGLDVLLYDMGDIFLAKCLTEKGDEFLMRFEVIQSSGDVDDKMLDRAQELERDAKEKISSQVPLDRLRQKSVMELFNASFWEEVAFACINCGICTFLCPTCWCFDIQDEVFKVEGDRIRNWDSCMFPLFTLHGSGHNPRGEKYQRVRQRFMHKLKYYVDKYGDGVQCSGCGRCVTHCPVNIDIRRIARLMNEL